jgi:sialate O-acetylesterase
MKLNFKIFIFLIACSLSFFPNPCSSQVRLPQVVRDSMVLQRDRPINIWGWAAPGEKVKVRFNKKDFRAVTAKDGKWKITLPATKAGGPFTMDLNGTNHIQLKEILVGDVWLCSGQSNMVHQMKLHADLYWNEIRQAYYPQIRQFWIATGTDLLNPHEDLSSGFWKAAIQKDIGEFSAVAYFFAKTVYEKYHVPIGLINASVGGSPIEAWISEEGLKDFPEIIKKIQSNKDTALVYGNNRKAMAMNAARPKLIDKGLTESPTWYDPSYIPKGWHKINVPGYWEDQGIRDLDGVVWYRKEFNYPDSLTGIPARLILGRIVDADFVYVNGVAVGNTGYMYPQRRYEIRDNILKPGKNTIVVRVINNAGKGGFVPDKPYAILAVRDSIDLRGEWQYKVGAVAVPNRAPFIQPITLENQPAALFNAMIAPIINYTIKGMLWYQGESNAGSPSNYARLQTALISDWRKRLNEGELPFLFAQLPNFGEVQYLPSESSWAALREQQMKTLSVSNTGMAITIDLGEWNDIHPMNKKDVGVRLAEAALNIAYGEKNVVPSGPIFQSAQKDGNKITVSFTNIGSGLISIDGEPLQRFAIAGTDKKFVWASARIEGDKVVVWNDEVSDPQYVRYAWADNPEGANLYNKEGLPASPFRTDN